MSFTALQRRVGNKMVARTAPVEDRSMSARKNKALNRQGTFSFDKDILVGRFASIGKGMSIGYVGGKRTHNPLKCIRSWLCNVCFYYEFFYIKVSKLNIIPFVKFMFFRTLPCLPCSYC